MGIYPLSQFVRAIPDITTRKNNARNLPLLCEACDPRSRDVEHPTCLPSVDEKGRVHAPFLREIHRARTRNPRQHENRLEAVRTGRERLLLPRKSLDGILPKPPFLCADFVDN